MRYGLYACAHPRTGSGATFVRRCSRVSVTLNAYAIATQATNRLLRQDFHLREVEQLSMRSELLRGFRCVQIANLCEDK